MLFVVGMYRFYTSFRTTRSRFDVILSEAKDLYESNTGNITFLLPYVRGSRYPTVA